MTTTEHVIAVPFKLLRVIVYSAFYAPVYLIKGIWNGIKDAWNSKRWHAL